MINILKKKDNIYIPDFIGFEFLTNIYNESIKILIFNRKGNNNNNLDFSYIYTFSTIFNIIPFWDFKTNLKGIKIILKEKYNNHKYIKNLELEKTLFLNKLKGLIYLYKKILIISGIGFKFQLNTHNNFYSELIIFAGFSHIISILIPNNIKCILETNTKLIIESFSKEDLGIFSAKIKNIKPIEIFKGKGIKYETEHIKLKNYKKAK